MIVHTHEVFDGKSLIPTQRWELHDDGTVTLTTKQGALTVEATDETRGLVSAVNRTGLEDGDGLDAKVADLERRVARLESQLGS